MTRAEIVEKIVTGVEDWDLDKLLYYVQGDMEELANNMDVAHDDVPIGPCAGRLDMVSTEED